VSKQADLQTVIAYLIDLDAELDERSAATPHANATARADMLYQLRHARQLAKTLERQASDKMKAWAETVEARIADVCGDRIAVAA
jgi:uncharacterized protein YabE (DUF348 family)